MPDTGQEGAGFRALGCFMQTHGGFLVFSALVASVLTFYLMGLFRPIAAESAVAPPDAVAASLANPVLVSLLFIPALLCGAAMFLINRGKLALLLVGCLLLLLPFLWVLYCFLMLIGPYYNYDAI